MLAITKKENKLMNLALTLVGSTLFFFVCANFKIYTSFSPVPITMHTFAVLTLGALLPFRHSIVAFGTYVLHGLAGAPFFGTAITLGGPSFGYFIGMAVALFFLSRTAKKMPIMLSMAMSSLILLAFGVLHLQFYVGLKAALLMGVVPFIIGDVLKLLAAYGFVKTLNKKLDKASV